MKNINRFTLLFACISLILGFLLLRNCNDIKTEELSSSVILNKISNIQELALVKYHYTGIIGYSDTVKVINFNVPFTEKYFLLKYNGYVKAGIDLSAANIRANGKNIELTLPKPSVIETLIDEKSIHVYNESKNPFNPTSISDFNKAIIREKNSITSNAMNQGILDNATMQAKVLLTSLLTEMGFENIKITESPAVSSSKK